MAGEPPGADSHIFLVGFCLCNKGNTVDKITSTLARTALVMPRIRVTRLAIPLGMKPERVQQNNCHKIVMLIGSKRLKTVPLPSKSRSLTG
jgi:hypothetical protein